MHKKSMMWVLRLFFTAVIALTSACSSDVLETGPNTEVQRAVLEAWVSDTAAPRLRVVDAAARGRGDPRQAWARERLKKANLSKPEYAVTSDELPQGAAAKVIRGENRVALIVVKEELLTDDVLQVARAALALDEIGSFGGEGIASGTKSRALLILVDGTILVPAQGGAWRRISPLPLSPQAANRSHSNESSLRLLQAVRQSPIESDGGVSLRRAGRVML